MECIESLKRDLCVLKGILLGFTCSNFPPIALDEAIKLANRIYDEISIMDYQINAAKTK